MLFTKEEIQGFGVDMTDNWQYEPRNKANVLIYCADEVINKIRKFMGISDEEWYSGEIYLDVFATVDYRKCLAESLYISDPDSERDLEIRLTNLPEKRAIYNVLLESGGAEYKDFLKGDVA